MLFHNATPHTLRFSVASFDYIVPPGDECDIPGPLAWVVKSRGLLLTEGPAPEGNRVEATAVASVRRPLPSGIEIGDAPPDEADTVEASAHVRPDSVNLRGRQKRK